MEIVLATRNKKKAEELNRMLAGMDIKVTTLNDFADCPEVLEDKDTFEGNAIKKALEVAACTGMIAVADDSGIVVDALGGRPGVFSARYAGDNADDAANLKKLLWEMKNIPDGSRSARFICCIAVAYPNGKVVTFEGRVEGSIGYEPKGRMGFGYDPVFYPEGHDRTFAEMSFAEKDSMSHRGKALERLKEYFRNSQTG
jgi:XTP/dITP diphosphohydrolase